MRPRAGARVRVCFAMRSSVERVQLGVGGAHCLDVSQYARVLCSYDESLCRVGLVGHLGGHVEARRVILVDSQQHRAEGLELLRELGDGLELLMAERGAEVVQDLARELDVRRQHAHRTAVLWRHA